MAIRTRFEPFPVGKNDFALTVVQGNRREGNDMEMNAVTLNWRRSSKCDAGSCVEVARTPGGVAVRDSKDGDGPMLQFEECAWSAFLSGVRAGEFSRWSSGLN